MWPFKRKPSEPLPAIPPSPHWDLKPVNKDENYVVTEEELTKTGMFRLFPWKKQSGE